MAAESPLVLNDIRERFRVAVGYRNARPLRKMCLHPLRAALGVLWLRLPLLSSVPVRRRVRTFFGAEMGIVLPEHVSLDIYRYRFYEEGLTSMLLTHMREGMTFLDIGAHFGFFSLLASTLVGAKGRVHSFEPTPSTFDVLSGNTRQAANVTANNLAVWSHEQTLELKDYGRVFSAYNTLFDSRLDVLAKGRAQAKTCTVQAVAIDSYAQEHGLTPNFVKIDAESAELEVLQGMQQTLDRCKPIVTVEVGDSKVAGAPLSSAVVTFLQERGYQAYEYGDGGIRLHEPRAGYAYDNLLFRPVS